MNSIWTPLLLLASVSLMTAALVWRGGWDAFIKQASSFLSGRSQIHRKQDPETRYDDDGTRYQCVSIPYRVNRETNCVQILMITSRNKGDYIFPGGGWEKEENGEDCALREAFEEAGIRGKVTAEIVSDQRYTSDKGNRSRLWGFLLEVTDVLENWPESERRRKWVCLLTSDTLQFANMRCSDEP